MDRNQLFSVELVSWAISALIGLSAAFLKFYSLLLSKEETQQVRDGFARLWAHLDERPWRELPQRVIEFVSDGSIKLAVRIDIRLTLLGRFLSATIPLVFFVGAFLRSGLPFALAGFLFALAVAITEWKDAKSGLTGYLRHLGIMVVGPATVLVWVSLASRLPFAQAVLVLVLVLPFLAHALNTLFFPASMALLEVLRRISGGRPELETFRETFFSDRQRYVAAVSAMTALFSHYILLSFVLTLAGGGLGHVAVPEAWVPVTSQMFLANAFFDFATAIATLVILGAAARGSRSFGVPLAALGATVLAALFACLSLWAGLAFTERSASVVEVLRVAVARSPDGTNWQLGPLFWVMHTTFLPVLFVSLLVLLAWAGKLVLVPVHFFLGRGKVSEKPVELAAALLTLIAMAFAALSMGLRLAK